MKSIVFCGSNKRFATDIKIWGDFLADNAVNVFIPEDFTNDPTWQGSELEVRDFAYKLTTEHFEKIKEYNLVFIFNKDGYSGLSTTLEIGCASGLGKSIYAIEKDTTEICRDVLFKGYFKTKEDLLEFLRSTE